MANKSIREFSAPTTDNIRTGPAAEIDGNFELKPGVIPDFKNKTRYAPYVSLRSQISHIATNKG